MEIVKTDIILTAAQEKFLDDSKYWLTPCLVAMAAWINDMPELADKALKEAIRRNDEKTSLLFALICRRADRKDASLKWTQRFLANQDEEKLNRNAIIILDAFASGLLGADSEGVVSKQMTEWLDRLSQKPGFTEQQTTQWSTAINLKRKPLSGNGYTYLAKYSKTWPVLKDILEGAYLHITIFEYFENIFNQETSSDSLKAQLDEILSNLVTEYDEEELPFREKLRFEELVIKYNGDDKRAKIDMDAEKTAFDTHKDFTQLLTDAAMKPEVSHSSVSTQKFAIAMSKEWITNAYNDVIAKNRMKIPHEIEINLESFNEKTTDGQNETQLIAVWNSLIEKEKASALATNVLTGFEQFCLWGGAAVGVVGILAFVGGAGFLGFLMVAIGIGMLINHFSKKKKVVATRETLETQFEEKRKSGEQIIRATLAEVVDFRAEFKRKDAESQKVTDFLEQIAPDQYVKKLAESTRRIKVDN